jgi:hypothetical protein
MEPASEDEIARRSKESVELLVYDFFKHLTTLSLVALGGVLSISTSVSGIDRADISKIVVILGVAGAISLWALDTLVKERMRNRPMPGYLNYLRLITVFLFGLGIGLFLSIVVNASL